MSETFNVGAVVQLKSGGPKMTVETIGRDPEGRPTVCCVWFDGKTQMHGVFPPDAVKAVGGATSSYPMVRRRRR